MIRIFVGCAPNGEDAESQAVLEYTLRKNSSEEIQIEWMKLSRDPDSFWHGWATERWPTPFSAFRWGIPARCGYEGKAIYMDSDIIVNGDIADLWRQELPAGKVVLAKHGGRLCVSLWDCTAAKGVLWPIEKIKSDPSSHREMGMRIKGHVGVFEGDWNCLDGDGFKDLTKPQAIHYTDMSCQPQLKHALSRLREAGQKHWFNGIIKPHPRADLQEMFDRLLAEASKAGFPAQAYVPEQPYGDFQKKSLANYKGRAA